ncbi:ATP-binding protein [Myxococcota bacterium]|nr:ATP-binding protein [Myxococcota bacterium]
MMHGVGLGYTWAEILGGRYGAGGVLQWRPIRGGAAEAATHSKDYFAISITLGDRSPRLLYVAAVTTADALIGAHSWAEDVQMQRLSLFTSHFRSKAPKQRNPHELRVRLSKSKIIDLPSQTPALTQLLHRRGVPEDVRAGCAEIADALSSIRFLDLHPDAMREPSPPGVTILGDRGENLSSVLQAISRDPARKEALLGWVRALTPMDVTELVFKLDHRGKVMVYLVEADGVETSAESASDGTLRFLALAAALHSPDTGKLFFFEELDNGIHPTRMHLLLQLVRQACKTQGVQVIATTHNPALLAFLDAEDREHAVLTYRPEGSKHTKVRRIMSLPGVAEVLQTQDLGRLLTTGWLEDAAVFSDADEPAPPPLSMDEAVDEDAP